MRPTAAFSATLVLSALAAVAAAQSPPSQAPSVAPAPSSEEEEVVVDVTTAVNELPLLLIAPAAESERGLAEEIRKEVELTGLFATRPTSSLALGMPPRDRWPGLAVAAVLVERDPHSSTSFPAVRSTTQLRAIKDELRRRELIEYPGTTALTAATLADAILEDVTGQRSHLSGRLLLTDASTPGERSIRLLSPDGARTRRISVFDSLARGGDFGPEGLVSYAAEDTGGKLALFREGQRAPIPLGVPGYVQGIAYSPDVSRVALSLGVGTKVNTWVGTSLDQLHRLDLGERLSLSPSVNAEGDVVHAVGPEAGPFTIYLNDKPITAAGVWGAAPAFCSTATQKRVVYMVRSGIYWEVRITDIATRATRTVAFDALSPACSPDGRTVAYYSPARGGKGPGLFLSSDRGGTAVRVWSGQIAGLRWSLGEALPPRILEKIPETVTSSAPPAPTDSAVPVAPPSGSATPAPLQIP